LDNVRLVLKGDIENTEVNRDSLFERYKLDPSTVDLTPIREDLLLREEVELEDKYNLFEQSVQASETLLFAPLKGSISQEFNVKDKHYAVDIVAPRSTAVKSISNGTVLFAEWTSQTGYVIIIKHQNDLTSVYKHNGALTKSQGDFVRAGEVIAEVGNTGELTTGPHLHFELWQSGKAVNPLNYIDFE
ncbi:MAG: M23 family metallopeptidase, partial [Bacteroidota bacterium]